MTILITHTAQIVAPTARICATTARRHAAGLARVLAKDAGQEAVEASERGVRELSWGHPVDRALIKGIHYKLESQRAAHRCLGFNAEFGIFTRGHELGESLSQ